jgi:hypothetical protein
MVNSQLSWKEKKRERERERELISVAFTTELLNANEVCKMHL